MKKLQWLLAPLAVAALLIGAGCAGVGVSGELADGRWRVSIDGELPTGSGEVEPAGMP